MMLTSSAAPPDAASAATNAVMIISLRVRPRRSSLSEAEEPFGVFVIDLPRGTELSHLMSNRRVTSNAGEVGAFLVRTFDRINDFGVTLTAGLFCYLAVVWFDAQRVGKSA